MKVDEGSGSLRMLFEQRAKVEALIQAELAKSQTLPSWTDIIRPSTVNLILGYKGTGKSALGYYVMEKATIAFGLTPIVVDFPKKSLLPPEYEVKTLMEALTTPNAVILVDEGTTKLPAGDTLEEFVKACSSLSRQRNQLVIFIFHTSRDVGSKALRGMDAMICKEPTQRQIRYGSKDPWFKSLLEQALAAFRAIPMSERPKHAFVDSEKPDYRGMLENSLPSFWSDELSTVWANADSDSDSKLTPELIDLLEGKSEVVYGESLECGICHEKSTKLISGVCDKCFRSWVARAQEGK